MHLRNITLLLLVLFSQILWAQKLPISQLKALKPRNIGPAGMSGRVTAIDVVNASPEHIYIGTASGGVWESQSGGVSWTPISEKMPTQAIGALKINQHNPSEIWIGTGEGNPRNSHNSGEGVFKSVDGGKNWQYMGLKNTKTIHRIIIHRDNPDIVWVAALGNAWGTNEERGVFKTTDGGKTWRKVLYVNDQTGCADLVIDPSNPNKLIAAMWEYGRKPWIFNSGGKGSGLYVSFDGGETWQRRTEKDGLPKGDLGRMGLAIAPSNPKYVYAIVEAKENGFYSSTDGGFTWSKAADKGFGDRPFYYSEIYADPKNERRVYSIFTTINRTEDGGRNWTSFAGWTIHPDHHAFWISPDNPDYLINGNDGGLNITRDGGKTWQFVENLPLGQFYHINIDDEIPFNVYGGLQDNGSWVGPSSVWRRGGILNEDWKEVYFGDGFDVLPRPDNHRYVYAMSQGGSLGYIDTKTGLNNYIKPQHPDGKKLRYNWNAALAQNPFAACGVYYGSQYVHKSMDCGKSWEIISPDLTTNDTLKQIAEKSGGLTPDVTAAENHCTILCIAPSPKEESVIWVGTDDGNIQLTKDGGKSWTNLSDDIKGMPKNAWVPQIEVSTHQAGEAFVIVNNYRQNDWKPYVFHTKDYGKKWKRIVDEDQVKGHALSIVQDPTQPNLLFLGTDAGLWISIDYGDTWTHFNEQLPAVNVTDMKIAKSGDLAIATFGRGIWILDDLSSLRAFAKDKAAALQRPFALLPSQDAYLAEYASYNGSHFGANATFAAPSKTTNAVFNIWVKSLIDKDAPKQEEASAKNNNDKKTAQSTTEKEKNKEVKIFILDKKDTIRTLKVTIDTFLNKNYWGLERKSVPSPTRDAPKPDADESTGLSVLPGTYTIFALYGTYKDSTTINVLADPRLDIAIEGLKKKEEVFKSWEKTATTLYNANERLRTIEKTLQLAENQLTNVPDSTKKDIVALAKQIRDSIDALQMTLFGPKETKGLMHGIEYLNTKLGNARWFIESCEAAPTPNALIPLQIANKEVSVFVNRVNYLIAQLLPKYQAKVEAVPASIFKKIDKVKVE